MVERWIVSRVHVRHVLRMVDPVVRPIITLRADPYTYLDLVTEFDVLAPESTPVADSI